MPLPFNFCSKSTSRWQIITAGLQPNENQRMETWKNLSDTRWVSHSQAMKAICMNYGNIQESLKKIADDPNQNLTTQDEARSLNKKMAKLEEAFLYIMWSNTLQRFQKTSTALQAVELDLCNATALVKFLKIYVAGLRDQFDVFEAEAQNMSPTVCHDYKEHTQRQRKSKKHPDATPECHLSGRQKFSTNVFVVVIDR